MNKFNLIIESVLEEAKIDDALKKSEISDELKAYIKEINSKLKNKSKYVDFLIKHATDVDDTFIEALNYFEDNVQRFEEKDINKYTPPMLFDKVDELKGTKTKSQKSEEMSKDAPIVWESDDKTIVVRKILSWEASKKYGAGTKWCITSKTSAGHWISYNSYNNFTFYFIHSTKLLDTHAHYKLAVVVAPNGEFDSIYNAPDHNIKGLALEYIKENNIPLDIFKPDLMEGKSIDEIMSRIYGEGSPITKNSEGTYDILDQDFNVPTFLIKDGKLRLKFRKASGNFHIYDHKSGLTTLEGCPEEVGGNFNCYHNHLTNLIGGPKKVRANYYCYSCRLTSLEGAPETVLDGFAACSNNLTDLVGSPKQVGGYYYIGANPGEFTAADVNKVCKVRPGNINTDHDTGR